MAELYSLSLLIFAIAACAPDIGNRKTVKYPNGTIATYTYDAVNRLKKLVNQRETGGPVLSQFEYTLGDAGNRTQMVESKTVSGSLQTTRIVIYEYDDLYRLTNEKQTYPNGDMRQFTFTYDKVGNRKTQLQQTHDEGGSPADTWALTTYAYDANDHLLERVETGGDGTGGFTRRQISPREQRDMMLATGHRARVSLTAFAAVSLSVLCVPFLPFMRRRRSGTHHSSLITHHSPEGKRAYHRRIFFSLIALAFVPLMAVGPETVHAASIQVMQAKAMEGITAAALASPGEPVTYTYNYDLNGNMTAESKLETGQTTPVVNTYVYYFENRLKQTIINWGGTNGTTDYTYDADGIRKSKTVGAATTKFITDKNRDYAQVLEERDGAGVLQVRYVYGDDLICQHRGAGTPTTSYYHYDGQMSTRQLTNASGTIAVTDTYTYDAFGGKIGDASHGGTENYYLYTGEQYDKHAKFYYLRARYYSQNLGRFTCMDRHGGDSEDPLSLHKYLYSHCDPINRIDPSGNIDFNIGSLQISISMQSYLAATLISYGLGKAIDATRLLISDGSLRQFEWFEWSDLISFIPGAFFAKVLKLPIQMVTRVGSKVLGKAFVAGGVPRVLKVFSQWFASTSGKLVMRSANGNIIELEAGTASKGFMHILRRHLVPFWNGSRPNITTFWPSNVTPGQLLNLLKEAVGKCTINGTGGYPVKLANGINAYLYIEGGKVVTFYPISGPGVILAKDLVKAVP